MLQLTDSRPAVYLLAFATVFLAGRFVVSFLRPKKAEKAEKAEKSSPGGIDNLYICIHSMRD